MKRDRDEGKQESEGESEDVEVIEALERRKRRRFEAGAKNEGGNVDAHEHGIDDSGYVSLLVLRLLLNKVLKTNVLTILQLEFSSAKRPPKNRFHFASFFLSFSFIRSDIQSHSPPTPVQSSTTHQPERITSQKEEEGGGDG